MPTLVPPTESEVCGSGATPNKGASREVFRKWIKAYLNLFGSSGTTDGAVDTLGAYRKGTILGAVSQVAGVPTGAIIETVTNANGTAIKFANGTLICTHQQSTSAGIVVFDGVIYRTVTNTWTFPVAFVANPNFFPTPISNGTFIWGALGGAGITTAAVSFAAFSTASSAAIPVMSLTAIGRWY